MYLISFLKSALCVLGGFILGLAVGWVVVRILGLIFDDALSEITVTLVGCYRFYYIILYFCRKSCLLLFGVMKIFSKIVIYMTHNRPNSPKITVDFVFCSAFILAEGTSLHVSGVLAAVGLGLYMSNVGRYRISPSVEEYMHQFWEMAEYIGWFFGGGVTPTFIYQLSPFLYKLKKPQFNIDILL